MGAMSKRNLREKVNRRTVSISGNESTRSSGDPIHRRVLVTGGAGFIGANLIRLLVDRGFQIAVLDNLTCGCREHLDGLPIEFIQGDIRNRNLVDQIIAGKNGVIHLAAQTGVPGSLRDPMKDCEVNILGTLNILEACREHKARAGERGDGEGTTVPRLIFASSNAPLGRQLPPASEEKAPLPISPYGASKLAGEAYCLAYHGSWGLETVALRFGNVYGPFSTHKGSVVAKFFRDILLDGRIVVDGDGEQTRDFIYVGDLCRAIVLALESTVSGEVIQIATGTETSIRSLASLLTKITGREVHLDYGPQRLGDVRRNYSNVSKAKRLLDWEPQLSLAEGLLATWGALRDGRGGKTEACP